MDSSERPGIDPGRAGASARREHARRRAVREKRVRDAHPRLGGLIVALASGPSHESAWERGAAGEERVAGVLAARLDAGVVLLHDRRMPGSRANIDHIAVAPSGVWVIDAKRYSGRVRVVRPLFGRGRLTIDGRDRSGLMDGLERQVAVVEGLVEGLSLGVPVHGALALVGAELPLLRTLRFRGRPVLHPRLLAKRINGEGPLSTERVAVVARLLAGALRPA